MTFDDVRRVWSGEIAVGATPDVGRVFMLCNRCRSVVPMWRVMAKKRPKGYRMGCKCGSLDVRVGNLPEWKAAAYVIGAFVWLKLIQRREQWDPRMAWQKE